MDIELRLGRYDEGQKVLADLLNALREGRVEINAWIAPELNDVAWLLATHPRGGLWNGTEAIRWATKACELTGWENEQYIGSLAAAYAESSDSPTAVRLQKKACPPGAADRKAARRDPTLFHGFRGRTTGAG